MEKMNKLKKEKKIFLDETMVKKPKLKHSSSSQLLSKDFPKLFSECAMFIRDRRNTNLTKNIMMAAPVTMNSTLDNARALDPLLKFIFKNWDVIQFIVLLIIKKLPRIIIHFHNFLVFYFHNFLVTICLVILIFPYFLFIRMFLNFHSILLSCSPHIDHLRHFQYFQDLIFDSWNVFQKKKFF